MKPFEFLMAVITTESSAEMASILLDEVRLDSASDLLMPGTWRRLR